MRLTEGVFGPSRGCEIGHSVRCSVLTEQRLKSGCRIRMSDEGLLICYQLTMSTAADEAAPDCPPPTTSRTSLSLNRIKQAHFIRFTFSFVEVYR